jgi:hypothetical protein
MESLLALRRENKEVLWSSMVKDTMKRKKPSFNEAYHGYRTFSELLVDAQKEGLLELDTDRRSRTYVVTRFGSEMHTAPAAPAPKKPSRRRRSSPKRRAESPAPAADDHDSLPAPAEAGATSPANREAADVLFSAGAEHEPDEGPTPARAADGHRRGRSRSEPERREEPPGEAGPEEPAD